VKFDGYKAHFIENRLYLIATGWSSDATRELLNRIGKNKLAVQTIVIFPYSFSFNELNELKTNLRTAFEKSNKIEVLERY
jgi:adenine-specific DNA-methyltransferase